MTQIHEYKIFLFRKDATITVGQEEGQKIQMALLSGEQKFIAFLNVEGSEVMLNVSAIETIVMVDKKEPKMIDGTIRDVKMRRGLTSSEEETFNRYQKLLGRNQKLLN